MIEVKMKFHPASEPPLSPTSKMCILQHYRTKSIRWAELKPVNEDDCNWRFADDNSEVNYDWNVIAWAELPDAAKIVEGIKCQ